MKISPKLICCFLLLVFLSGCKKSSSTHETSTTKPAASTNAAPATARLQALRLLPAVWTLLHPLKQPRRWLPPNGH